MTISMNKNENIFFLKLKKKADVTAKAQ